MRKVQLNCDRSFQCTKGLQGKSNPNPSFPPFDERMLHFNARKSVCYAFPYFLSCYYNSGRSCSNQEFTTCTGNVPVSQNLRLHFFSYSWLCMMSKRVFIKCFLTWSSHAHSSDCEQGICRLILSFLRRSQSQGSQVKGGQP